MNYSFNNLITLVVVLFLAPDSMRAQFCGLEANSTMCQGPEQPCCSEYGFCGVSGAHCGHGCQSNFSLESDLPPCYTDRDGLRPTCISGKYDFDDQTWIQNIDAYAGWHGSADFLVSEPQNVERTEDGLVLYLVPPVIDERDQPGLGARLSSTSYMLYGTFSARIRAGPVAGMVTSFISMSDDFDEIDWEFTGRSRTQAQTNIFYKGEIDYSNSVKFQLDEPVSANFHDYSVEWSENALVWSIDGDVVRTLERNSTAWPDTPSRIQFGVWDGGAGPNGTRTWAGGYIDWDEAPERGFNATFASVSIRCDGDDEPNGPPERFENTVAPTMNDTIITTTSPEIAGFVETESNLPGYENSPDTSQAEPSQQIVESKAFGLSLGSVLLLSLSSLF